jgi:hypothetical protein
VQIADQFSEMKAILTTFDAFGGVLHPGDLFWEKICKKSVFLKCSFKFATMYPIEDHSLGISQ